MTFLNAALLPGLALLAGLPLLIHLLNLRFPRFFQFSTVKHLKDTIAQRSRLFRWRHLILLALRTLLVIALIFVFLRPVLPHLGSETTPEAKRSVLILIDHSLSMEYAGAGVSSRERAQEEARRILAGLGADDVANVVLVGPTPKTCFVHLSEHTAEARRFVDNIKPGLARADFTQANAAAARLLGTVKQGGEVYFISDFQRKTWSNVDFTPLPPTTRIFFVDVGAESRKNRGITSVTVNQAQVLAGDTITLDIEVSNYTDEPLRESVKVLLDARVSFEKEISAGPWSSAKLTFPVPPGGPGLHWCEVSIPPDGLPQDDRFAITIPVLEKEGILIVSDAPDPNKDALRFLKTALNPYENLAGSLLPQQARAAELNAGRLAAVRKVFLTRSGPIDDTRAKQLADFIFHGGGVVWFLDGDNEPANLANLERALEAPLPMRPIAKRVVKNVGTTSQQIARGDFRSKFLRLFRGEHRQNLALLEFYDIHDATATGAGQILLNFADETPAMAQLDHGLGTLLLLNFSASELSSNLARQRVFPAWMQELVKNLNSDEPQAASSTIGETVTAEVWRRDIASNPLMKPSGAPQEVRTEAQGERVGLTFTPDEVGIYSMRPANPIQAFAVNPDPNESDLRPIERTLLPDQLGDTGKKGAFIQQREDYADLVRGRPIFHWFVFAALVALLAESLFQLYARRVAARAP